jgi:hypothetical protein
METLLALLGIVAIACLFLIGAILTSPGPAKFAAAKAFNTTNQASFVIGAKVANVINAAVQLLDARGQAVTQFTNVFVYLASTANGGTLSPTSPTSTTAIGTNGQILGIHSNTTAYDVLSNATGQFDLNITQTAGGTLYYLVVCMPDGSIIISPAIQF